ncbi:MAG: winged helix-turn-helix transcriptional regulator [Gammaproteobacteria bacterium]|nr:winged helix-turn-helix transcriptional regulator [Gammaproteobacteria bacterium]
MTGHRLQPQDLAATFAALGDQRRLAIVARLQEADELSVSSLREGMEVSRQAVSKHLKILADAQLVSVVKSGRETRYSLEPKRLEEANAFLALVGTKWNRALERLKSHVGQEMPEA